MIMVDSWSIATAANGGQCMSFEWGRNSTSANLMRPVHGNRVNVGFSDGHVQSMRLQEVKTESGDCVTKYVATDTTLGTI